MKQVNYNLLKNTWQEEYHYHYHYPYGYWIWIWILDVGCWI